MPVLSATTTLGEYADVLEAHADIIHDTDTAHLSVREVKALVKFVRIIKEEHSDPVRSWTEIGHAIENLEALVTL